MKQGQILGILIFLALNIYAQDLKILKPTLGERISYSISQQKEWAKAIEILKMDDYETYIKSEENIRILIDKLEMLEGPLTLGVGCSWYCGGGPYKISASSSLDTVNYKCDNIHDFNLFSGWVEGKEDYGIGEYIEFFFKPNSPRVNKIIVYNGYYKNKNLWESNSRVKKARLYVNNKPYAILEFQDISAPHSFSIKPVQSKIEGEDLILKFEILEVYPGTKYSDVVISEINFDGLDVHCFVKGTKVRLADGSDKNIENLKIGDWILTLDSNTGKVSSSIIQELESIKHHGLVTYIFESGINITATKDHPFMVHNKGWCSLIPEKSKLYEGFEDIDYIEIGDRFQLIEKNNKLTLDKLVGIKNVKGEQKTYTISKLNSGNNFIANGLVVGIEDLKE